MIVADNAAEGVRKMNLEEYIEKGDCHVKYKH